MSEEQTPFPRPEGGQARPTPGPWRVEEGTTLVWGECNAGDATNYGMGYPIAECQITPSGKWAKGPRADEGEANARLIAEAGTVYHKTGLTPLQLAEQRAELVEALETLLEEIEFEIEQRQDSGNAEDWDELEGKALSARTAIAKARGGAA